MGMNLYSRKVMRTSSRVNLKLNYESVSHLARQGYSQWAVQKMFCDVQQLFCDPHYKNPFNQWMEENDYNWSNDFKHLFKEEVIRLHKVGYTLTQMWKEFFNRTTPQPKEASYFKLEQIIRLYEEEVEKQNLNEENVTPLG